MNEWCETPRCRSRASAKETRSAATGLPSRIAAAFSAIADSRALEPQGVSVPVFPGPSPTRTTSAPATTFAASSPVNTFTLSRSPPKACPPTRRRPAAPRRAAPGRGGTGQRAGRLHRSSRRRRGRHPRHALRRPPGRASSAAAATRPACPEVPRLRHAAMVGTGRLLDGERGHLEGRVPELHHVARSRALVQGPASHDGDHEVAPPEPSPSVTAVVLSRTASPSATGPTSAG